MSRPSKCWCFCWFHDLIHHDGFDIFLVLYSYLTWKISLHLYISLTIVWRGNISSHGCDITCNIKMSLKDKNCQTWQEYWFTDISTRFNTVNIISNPPPPPTHTHTHKMDTPWLPTLSIYVMHVGNSKSYLPLFHDMPIWRVQYRVIYESFITGMYPYQSQ